MYNLAITKIARDDMYLERASATKKDPCGIGGGRGSNGIQKSLGARMRVWRATSRGGFR